MVVLPLLYTIAVFILRNVCDSVDDFRCAIETSAWYLYFGFPAHAFSFHILSLPPMVTGVLSWIINLSFYAFAGYALGKPATFDTSAYLQGTQKKPWNSLALFSFLFLLGVFLARFLVGDIGVAPSLLAGAFGLIALIQLVRRKERGLIFALIPTISLGYTIFIIYAISQITF